MDMGKTNDVNKMVEQNQGFIITIARQYQGRGLDIDDLVSEGNIGLIKAAQKFDPEKGVPFVNYAVVFIRRQIEKSLKHEEELTRVESNGKGMRRSVDAPLGSKANVNLLSVLVNPNSPMADERVYNANTADAVEYALGKLDERSKLVVEAYFGITQDHLTMAEIAEDMNLKRERVRQIRDHAIRQIKKHYKQYLSNL
jgi:RNA polymerase primary sigma factor